MLVGRATAAAIEPLLDAAGVAAGSRVLEVGCGLGDLAAAAAARGAAATGTDSPRGWSRPRAAAIPGWSSWSPTGRRCRSRPARSTRRVGAFVINHMPDAERGAAEMVRVTRARRPRRGAMWGPFEQRRAARPAGARGGGGRGGRRRRAGRPDSLRFTDAGELVRVLEGAGLAGVELRRDRLHAPVAGFDELWNGVLGGSVRTSRRLVAGGEAAREALREVAEPYRDGAGYALPTLVRIASGRRP